MLNRTRGLSTRFVATAIVALLSWGSGSLYAQEAAFGTAATEIAGKIAAAFPAVSGRVIALEEDRVLLDLGAKDAVAPGLELQVYRAGRELTDPSGHALGPMDRDVGRLRVLEVRPNFCAAEIIQQREGVHVRQGDQVRVPATRIVLALPSVDVADVPGAGARSITRDLANALLRTNRFEVLGEQRIRAALPAEAMAGEQFADPALLQALWKQFRVTAVLLGKLSLQEKTVRWDVQALSTVRGDTITLASADVQGTALKLAGTANRPDASVGELARRADRIVLRSQDLGYTGKALAIGELTGDGTLTLATSDGQSIYLYGLTKTGLKQLATIPGAATDNVIALDAADINGNGTAELFVTSFALIHQTTYLKSYVLEYQQGRWARIWEASLHFRVLDGVDGKPRLYAQGGGAYSPFEGPVREYVWQGGRYQPGAVLPLPKDHPHIFGFARADLDGSGAQKSLVLDRLDYLRVYDQRGEIYRSSDRFGGSENVVQYNPGRSWMEENTGSPLERIVLQERMHYLDLMGDGKRQLIVVRNTPSTGYVFTSRLYDKGKVCGLTWDGLSMQVGWESRELPGYVADIAVADLDGSGDKQIIVLVVPAKTPSERAGRSMVLVLSVSPPG
jgi:hypothetical protein